MGFFLLLLKWRKRQRYRNTQWNVPNIEKFTYTVPSIPSRNYKEFYAQKGFDPSDREKQIPIWKKRKNRAAEPGIQSVYFILVVLLCFFRLHFLLYLAIIVHIWCYQHDFIIIFLVVIDAIVVIIVVVGVLSFLKQTEFN